MKQGQKNTQPNFCSEHLKNFHNFYLIISPPRCSSTAFTRVFWEHPSIGFYCHEPFDSLYHKNTDYLTVIQAIKNSFNLRKLKPFKYQINNLVIKEITFQVGKNFASFIHLTTYPIIFLIRDPRLSIASRIKKLNQRGNKEIFPLIETGWMSLEYQLKYCQMIKKPYLIVDSTHFRNYPIIMFSKIFQRLRLSFSKDMLRWKPIKNLELGRIWEQQKHWYQRVLLSRGIQLPHEPIPEMSSFPETNGFRSHVQKSLSLYQSLYHDANFIAP